MEMLTQALFEMRTTRAATSGSEEDFEHQHTVEYVGMSETQRMWVMNALSATGLSLKNVKRVRYMLRNDKYPATSMAIYDHVENEMLLFPSFFIAAPGEVRSKRELMGTLVHELGHANDPFANELRHGGRMFPLEQIQARRDLRMLIMKIDTQSRISGKYIDGGNGYHLRLVKLLDEALSLNRLGEMKEELVFQVFALVESEIFAILTEYVLMSHGQLKKLEKEQRRFWNNPDNGSQTVTQSGEPIEFTSFVHELDRLYAVMFGFGSVQALKQQRKAISLFVDTVEEIPFEMPQLPAESNNA